MQMRRRNLEYAFARYGQILELEYLSGDPTAVVCYNDVEDAIKARTNLSGAVQVADGHVIRQAPTNSSDTTDTGRNN